MNYLENKAWERRVDERMGKRDAKVLITSAPNISTWLEDEEFDARVEIESRGNAPLWTQVLVPARAEAIQ